jgi:hypothetical protein
MMKKIGIVGSGITNTECLLLRREGVSEEIAKRTIMFVQSGLQSINHGDNSY